MQSADPGGNLAFNEAFMGMRRFFHRKSSYILASHADPDIIASLDRWLTSTDATLVISRIWERFVPTHEVGKTENRIIAVPDAGAHLPLGRHNLMPGACLHALGRQFSLLRPGQPHSLHRGSGGLDDHRARSTRTSDRFATPHSAHGRLSPTFIHGVQQVALRLWVRMALL